MKTKAKKLQRGFDTPKGKSVKKLLAVLLGIIMILTLAACGNNNSDETSDNQATDDTVNDTNIVMNTSPDKYTWYIKNYVGKNCASIGYTAMSGKRMDGYGEGLVELVFVSPDGSYVDVESEDVLKEYSVVKQNIAPNSVLKLVFDKDSEGNEYDSLVASQSYEEIVLCVKKNSEKEQKAIDLTEIKPSPDKYTWYTADYVGRNLASCGYTSMGGDLMHKYGEGIIELIIVADDGTFIDPEDTEALKNYVVTGQSVAPNTELKLTFDKDSDGIEYDNLVESQNIEEIELTVKRLSSNTSSAEKPEKTTKPATTEKSEDLGDGIRPEFKTAMDSYENFMNEYVNFMKKYKADPSDMSLLMDYTDYMSKYSEFVEDFEEWEDDDDMNAAETAYYIDVQARVSKKLLEIAE